MVDKTKLKEGAKKVLKGYGKEMKEAFEDGIDVWKNTPDVDVNKPLTILTRQKPLNALLGFF